MKTLFYISLVALLTLSACEDILDKEPLTAPSSENVLSTAREVQLALYSAYDHVDNAWTFCCDAEYSGTLNLDAFTDIAWNRSDGGIQNVTEGNMSNDIFVLQRYWDNYYRGIAKVNFILDNLDRAAATTDEATLRQFEGEAKFLRAFYYYMLTALYGDVVLQVTSPTADQTGFSLSSQEAVLAQVNQDLDEAITLLSEKEVTKNEANEYTARALKARVALYQQDYATAATQAQAVIDNGGYSLYPDYRTLFTHAGENNDEVIFSAGFLTNVRDLGLVQLHGPRKSGGDGWSIVIPTRDLVDSYETANGLPVDEDPAFDPMNPYENRDPRLNASIFTNGDVDPAFDPGFTFYVHPDSTDYADVTSAAASYSGFVWKKYVDATGLADRRNVGLDIIQIRLAEMYLIVAEANIENPSGDLAAARNALNTVRARAYGVAPSTTDAYPETTTTDRDELRLILRRERKVELAGEGMRLVDIRRWEIADDVLPGKIYGRALSTEAWLNNFQVPMIDDATGHVVYADESGFEQVMGAGSRSFNPATDYFWLIPLSEVDANDQID